jgi:ethanolamine ammonia-lyase small subunit
MTRNRDAAPQSPQADDPVWSRLRQLTAARIGLARSGPSLATAPLLDFKLAHARARDAVHEQLDDRRLIADLAASDIEAVAVGSAAADRQTYLMRPDLGRRLEPDAEAMLKPPASGCDVAFVVCDGLSARAVQNHAVPVLALAVPGLRAAGWRLAPVIVTRQGRVAVGDAVATLLRADVVAVLIGERPGLSAPDSMGAYLTWRPNARTSDADRNCISNIRPDGIGYDDAAFKLSHLLQAIRGARVSGVRLKDDSDGLLLEQRRSAPRDKPI